MPKIDANFGLFNWMTKILGIYKWQEGASGQKQKSLKNYFIISKMCKIYLILLSAFILMESKPKMQ